MNGTMSFVLPQMCSTFGTVISLKIRWRYGRIRLLKTRGLSTSEVAPTLAHREVVDARLLVDPGDLDDHSVIWPRSLAILSGFLKESLSRSLSSMIWPASVKGPST